MALQQIDAKMLSKMFLAGAKNLENKKEWINELNVFPVPDGDTGTNMTMTIMSAAREVSALGEDADMAALCKAISSGSLRGASDDVARQDTGRRERRFVNEDLSHGAENAAAEKGVEIVHQLSSPMFSRMTAWHTPGMLSPCMVEVGESSAPVGAKTILFHLPSRIPRRR